MLWSQVVLIVSCLSMGIIRYLGLSFLYQSYQFYNDEDL